MKLFIIMLLFGLSACASVQYDPCQGLTGEELRDCRIMEAKIQTLRIIEGTKQEDVMEFLLANWEYCMVAFYSLEKIVKITPVKWDDILVDGLKTMVTGFKAQKTIVK